MPVSLDRSRLLRGYQEVCRAVLEQRVPAGHWQGELSTSPLATATAVMALELVSRSSADSTADAPEPGDLHALPPIPPLTQLRPLIDGGIDWLARHQNPDGGWGDTLKSVSNISTTMLCHAAFHATGGSARYQQIVNAAAEYVSRAGGRPALLARYGKDRTFSIPILTHCALAGLVEWRDVAALPFELACLPAEFYRFVRLPVVSYALPALIGIGLARHHFAPPHNPLLRAVRHRAVEPSLRVLERIQPSSGGYLEATPLTSFVTMSLAGVGRAAHPVARRGVEFLIRSVRPDGSWPIDTNLATWVTTLAVNALGSDLPLNAAPPVRQWLLGQQYRTVHPYTNAAPGGWAWTDLPGGVPDLDDTPGAMLALMELSRSDRSAEFTSALELAGGWLLAMQNRNGGWPTFCRGWGTMPFDRSSADITAHALRALVRWTREVVTGYKALGPPPSAPLQGVQRAIRRGFRYLDRIQRPDGAWLPLWFGNQFAPQDENPVYGTSRVLAAYRDAGREGDAAAQRGRAWLQQAQNADGGWGGVFGTPSSVEETALALEVLISLTPQTASVEMPILRGLTWLLDRIDQGTWMEPSPIGFYFAKLWYFERLYPMIFTVAALRRAANMV
ncbi:MAG: prenyltransferase/squalene oxidase repeat-containing protein [Planctomycetales bacterium]